MFSRRRSLFSAGWGRPKSAKKHPLNLCYGIDIIHYVEFEYDPKKSHANAEKRGIDFDRARFLWLDEKRWVIPARSMTENKEAIIAELEGVPWTAIYTLRDESIRIISVRRSRNEERQNYHNR